MSQRGTPHQCSAAAKYKISANSIGLVTECLLTDGEQASEDGATRDRGSRLGICNTLACTQVRQHRSPEAGKDATPERGGDVHLEKEDADDHEHPGDTNAIKQHVRMPRHTLRHSDNNIISQYYGQPRKLCVGNTRTSLVFPSQKSTSNEKNPAYVVAHTASAKPSLLSVASLLLCSIVDQCTPSCWCGRTDRRAAISLPQSVGRCATDARESGSTSIPMGRPEWGSVNSSMCRSPSLPEGLAARGVGVGRFVTCRCIAAGSHTSDHGGLINHVSHLSLTMCLWPSLFVRPSLINSTRCTCQSDRSITAHACTEQACIQAAAIT